jgi:outer membrane receptor for ferrienterochelin and colicins
MTAARQHRRLPCDLRCTPVSLALLCAFAANAQTSPPAELGASLPTITITGKSNQGDMRKGALREVLVKTESISERAIERSGATNLTEALGKDPGIAVQVECSICNVRNVLLNNLPGRYTTLMIDGVPIFSSVSSAYGLDSVSVYGVERIDVARGAGASLIAPEALAGTVNIVTKRPSEAENRVRLQLGSYGSRQADAYLARPFDGGALTATVNVNKHDSVDADGNGVSEYTGYHRRLGGLGWFLGDVGGFKLKGRLDLVDEKRGGGALGTDYAAIKANNSGNPFNWSRGVHGSPDASGWINPADGSLIPYDSGRGGFSEIIFTRRTQLITTAEKRFGDSKLRLAFGAAQHKQDSFYEGATYIGKQNQGYTEASWQMPLADWVLTTGVNYRYEDLKSHGSTAGGTAVTGIDDYAYKVPAVYLQVYRSFFDDALELNGSVRNDKHNVFGGITSPRLNALWHHTPQLASRFSAGKGFRAPTSFFEQDHGILDTIRIDRQISKPEVSTNLSYALSYADDRLAVTGSLNHNRIKNFAILDPGATDPVSGDPITVFTSAVQPVTVQGADINLSYLLTPALTVTTAAEFFRYRFPPGTLVFARPKAKAYVGMDYEQGGWDVSAKLVWTGTMDLRRFHGDGSGSQNRYNFDGTPKRDKSPSFFTLDMRAEYAVGKTWSVYVGADNLLDYKQSDKESMLFVDGDGAPDVVHLWGPNRGRYVYAGVKASF